MYKINPGLSIHQLSKQYPDLLEILSTLGFPDIRKPGMISTVGRIVTLRQGCQMKQIVLDDLSIQLQQYGYVIEDQKRTL